jgi:hypothetical protein
MGWMEWIAVALIGVALSAAINYLIVSLVFAYS